MVATASTFRSSVINTSGRVSAVSGCPANICDARSPCLAEALSAASCAHGRRGWCWQHCWPLSPPAVLNRCDTGPMVRLELRQLAPPLGTTTFPLCCAACSQQEVTGSARLPILGKEGEQARCTVTAPHTASCGATAPAQHAASQITDSLLVPQVQLDVSSAASGGGQLTSAAGPGSEPPQQVLPKKDPFSAYEFQLPAEAENTANVMAESRDEMWSPLFYFLYEISGGVWSIGGAPGPSDSTVAAPCRHGRYQVRKSQLYSADLRVTLSTCLALLT